MPLWGQKQQKLKVKTRSIFVDEQTTKAEDLVGIKTNEQIRAARQKIRTNFQNEEKVDDTVLEFRKSNELHESEYNSNLNPLIVYEPKETDFVKQVLEPVQPEEIKEEVLLKEKYEEFKKNNLTSKYKTKRKISQLFTLLSILTIVGSLAAASLWNQRRLSEKCAEIAKKAMALDILKDDNEDCSPPKSSQSFSTLYNLLTFGFEYNQQIDIFEKELKTTSNPTKLKTKN